MFDVHSSSSENEIVHVSPDDRVENAMRHVHSWDGKYRFRPHGKTVAFSPVCGSSNSSESSFSASNASTDEGCEIPLVTIGTISVASRNRGFPRVGPKPMALDLFSGKGSVRRALEEMGYEVVSVDINPKFAPTHACDIMQWHYHKYRPGTFEVICASSPCTEYSRAKTIGSRRLVESDQLFLRTLEIVDFLSPNCGG